MAATIKWKSASGTEYPYTFYPINTEFSKGSGNYVFAKKLANGNWTRIYAGETGDFSERFDSHHAMPCIKREGATHITIHATSKNAAERRAEEKDIRDFLNPPCNG